MKLLLDPRITSLLVHSSRRGAFSSLALGGNNKPIQWGILSAGKISSDYAKAIQFTPGAECKAVAARCGDKAASFASAHSIPKSYGSYEHLLADPDIDVVYVGSVADQHAKLATEALLVGKPTVVEKPFTLSHEDTKRLVELAKRQDVFLMEGMWTRSFPAMRFVRDLIVGDEIGKVVMVQGDFGWSTDGCGPQDRIWSPQSGGMTLDIGMYMVQLGQVAFGLSKVENVHAIGNKKNGVDHTVAANVVYEQGGILQFYVTGEANTEERVVIQGTKGRIVMDSPAHVPSRVRVLKDEGRGAANEQVLDFPLPDDSYTSWNYPGSIGFTHQIQAVGAALAKGEKECPHFTLSDSLQVASILDDILEQVHGTDDQSDSDDEAVSA